MSALNKPPASIHFSGLMPLYRVVSGKDSATDGSVTRVMEPSKTGSCRLQVVSVAAGGMQE